MTCLTCDGWLDILSNIKISYYKYHHINNDLI